MPANTMTQAVKRACDACHRRKVKCDGVNPCRNCFHAGLTCTYHAVPQKKGPKGSRAKVISELRETQRQTSLFAKVQNRLNGNPCPNPTNPSLMPTPGFLSSDLVKECVNFFFEYMYAQLPILDRAQVEQQVLYMEQNKDAYCLMTSLCAFVLLQPGMNLPGGDLFNNLDMVPGANIASSQLLVEETLKVRKGYEYLDTVTLNALATNFFLFGCHYSFEMHDRAWYYLREATTMVHMVGMNKEDHYMQSDIVEASRRRRLFWLLYISERSYALKHHWPLTLQATINLPTVNDDPTDPLAQQLDSFVRLATIFKPFDDTLISTWNKSRANLPSQHISTMKKQLGDLVQTYLCQDPNFTDLHINQQWLKSTVWQLTNGSLNGSGGDSLSFQYPNNMSRDLMAMASQFPNQGMEMLQSGLIEKMMELAHSLNEHLSRQPPSRDRFAPSPHGYLEQILSIVALSRTGDHRFLPLLLHKLSDILPRQANPMLQNAPENIPMADFSIFGEFGMAGMAQVPAPMQIKTEPDIDHNVSYEDYDKYDMQMCSGTPDSNHSNRAASVTAQQGSDMSGSFVGSPAIISSGMDYQSGINNFSCAPMNDIVMSPLGHQGNPMQQAQSQHAHQNISSQRHNHGHDTLGPHNINHNQQAMHQQGIDAALSTSHALHNMEPGPAAAGFQMQGPPGHIRGIGEYQRANALVGGIGSDIEFAALR